MKRVAMVVWLVGVMTTEFALAQNPAAQGPARVPDEFRQMEMRSRQLDLQARENKLNFEREMKSLDLQQRRLELARAQHSVKERPTMAAAPACPTDYRSHCRKAMGMVFFFCGIIHILLAVWVYQDIRRRDSGSGIWIIIALLTGLFGTAVYALVRLGEKPAEVAG